MTRDEQTERSGIDGTRMRRFFEAIRLTWPIVDDILPRVERVLGNEHAEEEPLKTAALAGYEKAREVVTNVGLEIRHRALKYTVTNVPGRAAGLRIDVEFALAAPLDGPDAPFGVGAPFVHRLRRGGVRASPLGLRPPVLALRQADAADRGRYVPARQGHRRPPAAHTALKRAPRLLADGAAWRCQPARSSRRRS